jgi:hypothetical protein
LDKLTVSIFTPQELNHSSYMQTGLFELENEVFLKTKVILSFAKRLGTLRIENGEMQITNQPHPKTSFYKLKDPTKAKTISFATDLYDAPYSFSKYALDHCDFVFKRNFEASFIEKLPGKYQKKILPLGLTFPSKSQYKKEDYKFFISLIFCNLRISTKIDRLTFKRLFNCYKEQINHWNSFKSTRSIKEFEEIMPYSNNAILFQTRCFPHENEVDAKQIHQQRYNITLLLRDTFKDRFYGGIIPSALAYKKYSEALSNLPSDPISYLNMIKKSKIVIYTRGLANSPAWKMAEYLSQGKVIIAEKLSTELVNPLTDGKEVLFFENHHDLIDKINLVLFNEELSSKLSLNAKKYFEDVVHPKQNIKRIINLMLQHKTIE